MVGALEARTEGVSCDAIIKIGAETLRAQQLLVNRFVRPGGVDARSTTPAGQKPQRGDCLTSVFDVANDAIVDRVSDIIEEAVVVPVHVAVGVEVLANDRTNKIRAAVDR